MIVAEANKDTVDIKFFGQIGVDSWSINGRNFDAWFNEFDQKYKNINIKFHCYGGVVFEGNVIMNTLSTAKAFVTIDVVGVAASMGGLILQKAGKRRIARNGFVMVHSPTSSQSGNAREFESTAKLLRDMEDNFTEEFHAKTGKPKEDISKLFDGNDYWFPAKEALKYGLVDEIIDPVADIKDLDKKQAEQLGQEAMYNRYTACLKIDNKPELNTKKEMDKTELIAKAGLTGVNADSSDTAVFDALGAKLEAEKNAKEKAEQELKEFKGKGIKAEVDEAVKDGRIVESERATYEAIGEKAGLDVLKQSLSKLKSHEPIIKTIKGESKKPGGERADWTWKDYQEKDPSALEKLDKETFNALYKAEYGVEPKE